MSAPSYVLRDSATMLRRDVLHSVRYLPMTLSGLGLPILFLLLFNYVFGGAIGAGLGGVKHGGSYLDYLAPGIIAMTIASGCETTALNVCQDMAEGIITRFRTMAISRASVLVGQVVTSLIQTLITIGVVVGVALLMGFRPTSDPAAWLLAIGVIALFTFAITWMGVLFGLIGKTPAGANSLALIFQVLALTSSAFVSPSLMPPGVRWFAEYQPFTPVIDTLRGLLLGTPIAINAATLAVAWCAVLALVGYLGARAAYERVPMRSAA